MCSDSSKSGVKPPCPGLADDMLRQAGGAWFIASGVREARGPLMQPVGGRMAGALRGSGCHSGCRHPITDCAAGSQCRC